MVVTASREMSIEPWSEQNQTYLINAIGQVKAALQNYARQISNHEADDDEIWMPPIPQPCTPPSAVELLCQRFELNPFDRDILLLCAGIELDGGLSQLCTEVTPQSPYATFSLALAILSAPIWSSLTPHAPLRRWRLIEVGPGNALTTSPLRIDERILHYVTGIQQLDQRLVGLVEPIESNVSFLVESHQIIADRLTNLWVQASESGSFPERLPVLQLLGEDGISKGAIAQSVCQVLGLNLYRIPAETLTTDAAQFNLFILLCEREYILANRVFWLDCDGVDGLDSVREQLIARLVEQLNCPLILTRADRQRQRSRPIITVEISAPTPSEQRLVWQASLNAIQAPVNSKEISSLVDHFNLSTSAIQSASFQVRSRDAEQTPIFNQLWSVCRQQARPRLDELAQRIDAYGDWDDLVLPEKEHQVLRDITAHVKQRSQVYENWGFGSKSPRGLGISALFSGASGTGKTTAAEAIAQVLQLDIYRIDLSAVVSKYIGETEKNLRRIFDAAEGGGVILLFDEADSLFGKRSEVKDSHDRNANLEVSYLLQRMETYRGLAILTTNLKGSIDSAFMRRIRFIVQFPFPDAAQRADIWRRVFPAQAPTEGLDFDKLAKLSIAGGNIRNIALNAAFIAADAGESVQMKHVLRSAKSEYVKLERPLTDAEIKGWV
jgi:SpoVK/Ycf46/Vps4 family AAA+-type ATPase